MNEKTVKILGKEVRLRYCAATENGFETIREKSISKMDFTKQEDLITLAVCAIVAAYARTEEEPPVTSQDIIYDCTPTEIVDLVTAVIELRNEWYKVPSVVETGEETQSDDEEEEAPKN